MMADSTEEEMPTFVQFFKGVSLAFSEFGLQWDKYPANYPLLMQRFTSLTVGDIVTVVSIAFTFTIIRILLTKAFSIPLGQCLRLMDRDMIKFSESTWKLLIYSLLWGYSLHVIVLSGRYTFFQKPCAIMNFTTSELDTNPVPSDIYLMYVLQIGFYIHSLYATLFLDVWRKDSIMMIFHHCLTIFLLYFSLCMKYYKIGALVLLLHDISDILLEVTKINVYLKMRGGVEHKLNDLLSSIGFGLFAISWAWCRLYWFPLKVLHSTNYGVYLHHLNKEPHMYLAFNCMLFLLQFLHIYWFFFIIIFLYKVATGQASAVEDTREYDEQKDVSSNNHTSISGKREMNNHGQNNHASSARKKVE